MSNDLATDRVQRLRDDAEDATRERDRIARLLKRQLLKRRRLTKAIDGTRRRLLRATETAAEAERAAAAAAAVRP